MILFLTTFPHEIPYTMIGYTIIGFDCFFFLGRSLLWLSESYCLLFHWGVQSNPRMSLWKSNSVKSIFVKKKFILGWKLLLQRLHLAKYSLHTFYKFEQYKTFCRIYVSIKTFADCHWFTRTWFVLGLVALSLKELGSCMP